MNNYTDFILTVIAILLAMNLLQPLLTPAKAVADDITNVNIAEVGGKWVSGIDGLKVHIKE